METTYINNVRIIVAESIDFWLEYLSVIKVFILKDPTNILILKMPELYKYRLIDPVNICIELEKKIVKAVKKIKGENIGFYSEYHFRIEGQLKTFNEICSEFFINHEAETVIPKVKMIILFLRQELLNLEKLIRSMAACLPEDEIATIDKIFVEGKSKVTKKSETEIPSYMLAGLNSYLKTSTSIKQDQLIKFMVNRATVFLLIKLQESEHLNSLLGFNGNTGINNLAKIAGWRYEIYSASYIFTNGP